MKQWHFFYPKPHAFQPAKKDLNTTKKQQKKLEKLYQIFLLPLLKFLHHYNEKAFRDHSSEFISK